MSAKIDVHSVTFSEGGLAVSYMKIPTDVRVQGRVIQTHTIQLHASHPDYAQDIADLLKAVTDVVSNALEDFDSSEPFQPGQDDDEDDDRGMGE